ncbi:MAG: polyprenyl synthetase family protein [Candidatus Hodarchaeota archaeon]
MYDLLADYPFREGKGLRPAICFSACRAAGGRTEQAQVSACALELFHNAFLVHDDVEDGSLFRRGKVTLFKTQGVPVAINVGDATNVLAMRLLLDNLKVIGVRKSLQVFQEVERMARESVEGQAIELDWIRNNRFELSDADYIRMAFKKTCWYTVIAPLRIGVICGSPPGIDSPSPKELSSLNDLGFHAGIAFQIHDDLLNLHADETLYGKEISGDLWEGKRTIMLLHFLRTTSKKNHTRALKILKTPRASKKPTDVAWLYKKMIEEDSTEYGRNIALEHSEKALNLDRRGFPFFRDNESRQFLRGMIQYVIEREK